MRLSFRFAAITASAIAAATVLVASPDATATTSFPATHTVVVRPVTASGHAVAGYTVKSIPSTSIDCSSASPSPGAVSKNIDFCSPSAAYAVACWHSSHKRRALCLMNPTVKKLAKFPLIGKFAKTGPADRSQRAPLLIVLSDGTRCSIRDGGAWGTLKSHPRWVGTYRCTRHGVVWSPASANHYGVNESASSWTVHVGAATGSGKLSIWHITRAYFVGTRS